MKNFDLIVVGAGPGGYVAAIRAAQMGLKTAVVEKDRLGGMCLNWGCVPSRRLMESARLFDRIRNASAFGVEGIDAATLSFNWKKAVTEKDRIVAKLVKGVEYLMKKNKIDVIKGTAGLRDGTRVVVGADEYAVANVILATGSRPDRRPVENLPAGLVAEVDDLYARADLPQNMVVAGGSPAACEMASMLRLLGKTVTMVMPEASVVPWLDPSLIAFITEKFKKSGIVMHTASRIDGTARGGVKIGSDVVPCDLVVNTSNRAAVLPELADTPLAFDGGFVRVNEFMQTSVPSVYAIGDVTGSIFAHVASAQGTCAVNHIAGLREPINYGAVPLTIYMDPEISSVGLSEAALKAENRDYVAGEFPMSVNSKALVEGSTEGFVKMLADQKYGEILGVHVVAARATELISEAVMCIKTEGTLDDLTTMVHAHPTVSETFLEAGFKASGKPLHI